MKKTHKTKFIFLIVALIILTPTLSMASSTSEPYTAPIPIERLDTLPIEETYSYEEMVESMKQNNEDIKSIQEFKNAHKETIESFNLSDGDPTTGNIYNSGTVRYSVFSMERISKPDRIFVYHFTPQIQVGLLYRNNPTPERITSLSNPYIHNTGATGSISGGNFVYELISGREFYTWVSGNVYKDGITNVSGSITVGIGDSFTATISASGNTSNKGSVSSEDSYYSPALSQ